MGRTLTGLTEYSCVSLLGAWVAGIFFMLLTTVSLLQLREVLHPRCMAHRVRPQEPQVDVVGVMVKEGIGVQGKRMVWSGVFYGFVMVCWKVAVKVRTRGKILVRQFEALTQTLWSTLLPHSLLRLLLSPRPGRHVNLPLHLHLYPPPPLPANVPNMLLRPQLPGPLRTPNCPRRHPHYPREQQEQDRVPPLQGRHCSGLRKVAAEEEGGDRDPPGTHRAQIGR